MLEEIKNWALAIAIIFVVVVLLYVAWITVIIGVIALLVFGVKLILTERAKL